MKLTKDIRANILYSAMKSVPTIDYVPLMIPVIQGVLYDFMPAEAKAAYDNPETRIYLHHCEASVKTGNGNYSTTYLCDGKDKHGYDIYHFFYGSALTKRLEIRTDLVVVNALPKKSLNRSLSEAINKSGLFDKHLAQQDLLKSVTERLRATLASVTTTNRLYDVLEPELHHLIPKDNDKTANLPATVAPVVDDLRKLGALLPSVPKAA